MFRLNKGDAYMKSILLALVLLIAVLPSFANSTAFKTVAVQNGETATTSLSNELILHVLADFPL